MQKDLKALSELYSRIIIESSGRKVIRGNVNLTRLHLTELPEWLVDIEVTHNFNCSYNLLTSLKNAPKKVGGNFHCECNRLTSLQGAPESMKKSFYCHENRLTSLQDAPKKVGGDFFCSNNNLITLQGAPTVVGSDFYCFTNYLTSLQGAPKKVGGSFVCRDNPGKFTFEDVVAVCEVGGSIKVHDMWR